MTDTGKLTYIDEQHPSPFWDSPDNNNFSEPLTPQLSPLMSEESTINDNNIYFVCEEDLQPYKTSQDLEDLPTEIALVASTHQPAVENSMDLNVYIDSGFDNIDNTSYNNNTNIQSYPLIDDKMFTSFGSQSSEYMCVSPLEVENKKNDLHTPDVSQRWSNFDNIYNGSSCILSPESEHNENSMHGLPEEEEFNGFASAATNDETGECCLQQQQSQLVDVVNSNNNNYEITPAQIPIVPVAASTPVLRRSNRPRKLRVDIAAAASYEEEESVRTAEIVMEVLELEDDGKFDLVNYIDSKHEVSISDLFVIKFLYMRVEILF